MIEFSSRYEPLFELLTCRQDLSSLNGFLYGIGIENVSEEMLQKKDYLTKLCNVDTVLISGGRDSGKSFGFGVFAGVATYKFQHRLLYTRQTMSSTDNSITQALDNRLELLGIQDEFEFANNLYRVKRDIGKISITGQKTSVGTQTAKLKSLEDFSIFATDEGEELKSYDDWLKVKRSIRATDVQCFSVIIFNPPTKSHWLYETFYETVPAGFNGVIDNILYIHTTYLDNGQENMAQHNWREYESLRLQYEQYEQLSEAEKDIAPRKLFRAWREYKTSILGGFRDIAEGVIFEYTIGEFEETEYGSTYGADQGFTHPSAFIKVSVDKDKRKIWLKQILYKTSQTISTIYDEIKDEVGFTRIWCDDAAPMFIKELFDKGLNIKGAKKPKIKDRINAALDYEIIIDPSSKELILEFNEYRWSDKNKDVPADDNNHAMDAWGYAFYRMIKTNYAQAL